MIKVLVRKKPDREHLQLCYVDPLTGQDRTKSAKTSDWSAAERKAAVWEAEVNQGHQRVGMSWDTFRVRFEDEHLTGLSSDGRQAYGTAMNQFEKLIGCPRSINDIDSSVLSQFVAKLRKKKFPPSTVTNYVKHVLSALGWAAKMSLVYRVPKIILPRESRRKLMRSRPITDAEFELMQQATQQVRPGDHERWERFQRGLWLSGLRLSEALRLSWDAAPLRVDLSGRRPRIVAFAEGHKARSDELIPITPDFFAMLNETKAEDRRGRVFDVLKKPANVGKVIREIAEAAGVVVNDSGKFATAHDFRRAFGTRWAMRVHPMVLQRLMRHKTIETTMRYYVDLDADVIADQIWEANLYPSLYPQKPSGEQSRPTGRRKTRKKTG